MPSSSVSFELVHCWYNCNEKLNFVVRFRMQIDLGREKRCTMGNEQIDVLCVQKKSRLKRTFINLMIRWKKRLVHLKDLIKSLKIFYTFVAFSPKIVLNYLDLNTNIEWINFLAPKALTRLQNSFKSRISCCEFFVIRRKIPAIYRNGKYKCYGFESIKLRENFENRFRVSVCVHIECCACLVSICTELFAFIKWYLSRLWQR